jgi:ferredoxin
VVRRAQKACRRGRIDDAVAIDRLLRYVAARAADTPAGPTPPPYRAFSVRLGKMTEGELQVLLAGASASAPLQPADPASGFTDAEASAEAQRCLHCDCRAAHSCKLRDACDAYGVDVSQLPTARPALLQDRSHPDILYEPGKCIRCGLCLQVAERAGEQPGLAFAGRGFAMQVKVPFGAPLAQALAKAGGACADVCPTAALARQQA